MLAALGSLAAGLWAAIHLRTLLLGAFIFLFVVDFLKRRRPKNYPPGPPYLPFFGNFFQLDFKQPHQSAQQFVKKYGNILSLDLGYFPSITVTGLPLIKEVLTNADQRFMSRPVTAIRHRVFKKHGLIMSSGQEWKEQRRFALTTLRNFGLGKKSIDERIQEEAYYLAEEMQEEKGLPFDPHFKINNAVANIICSITFGERFEYEDDQFKELLRLLDEATYLEASVSCELYNIFPWIMRFLPGVHQTVIKDWEKLKVFVSRMIENHRKDWNPDEPRDFIDAYLKEMTKFLKWEDWWIPAYLFLHTYSTSVLSKSFKNLDYKKKNVDWRKIHQQPRFVENTTLLAESEEDMTHFAAKDQRQPSYAGNNISSFHEENLVCSTLDLFFAGTETTSTTLRWALLHMALNPEIQEKVQAEIDRVLGQSQVPSTANRDHMPYTNAVIHEVQRMGNIVPLNIPREVTSDTTLSGYYLPKGTLILTNLTALHRDPKEWATPETFNPEHFLENGQFKKKEAFMPFSIGKRVCIGEQLARAELFIFFTSLLQKFTFKPPANEKLSLKFRSGLTLSPVSYRICAVPRV